jgi:hypothetical protein
MQPSLPTPEQVLLDAVRRRRIGLHESMIALEQAFAAPAPGRRDTWVQRVHAALAELVADFREHIDITEGPSGLYADLRTTEPRLSHAVARLTREHAHIRELLEDLLALASALNVNDVDAVRDLGTALLGSLIRHRQHGSDLIYEAYAVDVGGET